MIRQPSCLHGWRFRTTMWPRAKGVRRMPPERWKNVMILRFHFVSCQILAHPSAWSWFLSCTAQHPGNRKAAIRLPIRQCLFREWLLAACICDFPCYKGYKSRDLCQTCKSYNRLASLALMASEITSSARLKWMLLGMTRSALSLSGRIMVSYTGITWFW